MSGGDQIGSDHLGVCLQPAELEPLIAHDTGVWGSGRGILVGEIIDQFGKIFLEIQGVERDIHPAGNQSGVIGIGRGAAASMPGWIRLRRLYWQTQGPGLLAVGGDTDRFSHGIGDAESHEDADDVVALLLEQARGDAAVHAAAHCHQNFRPSNHPNSLAKGNGGGKNRSHPAHR